MQTSENNAGKARVFRDCVLNGARWKLCDSTLAVFKILWSFVDFVNWEFKWNVFILKLNHFCRAI